MRLPIVLPLALFAGALGAHAAETALQNPLRAMNFEDRMYRYWEFMIPNNFALDRAMIEGSGGAGSTQSYTLDLNEGMPYLVSLFCDANCTDVDMTVVDASGATPPVDDETPNDESGQVEAEVGLTAAASQDYTFDVTINACSMPSCDYAIAVFSVDDFGTGN